VFISRTVLHLLSDISMVYGEGAKAVEALLKETGFAVSQICQSRPSCFDFAARKGENLILIRVQRDIDNLSPGDSSELSEISRSISATSLLISENAREKPLEEDTVYSRYNVSAVTQKTFENIVSRKAYPLIQAGPGGYYVEIDGPAIRRRRQELGLSVGKIAEMSAISRRTIYGYERGMAKASVTAAYNLMSTLGIPVAKPINVFEKSTKERKCLLLTTAKRVIARNRLLTKIFQKFTHYGISAFRKAPFDFVITVSQDKMRIIGGVANTAEPDLEMRADEILSLCRVVQAHPVLITDGQELANRSMPCIQSDEFSNLKNPEDLIHSIT
jgi:putative transcriptional regulator